MQTSYNRQRRAPHLRAFTLVELVVVILIIAILAALLFTAGQTAIDRAKKAQAKNDLTQIVTAVNAFYTEYGKYPIDSSLGSGDVFYGSGSAPSGITIAAQTTDKLFDVLRNNAANSSNSTLITTLNARAIVFLNAPSTKSSNKPMSGILTTGSTNLGVWYDPWGVPYNVLIDGTYDNQVPNPYASGAGPALLQQGVVAWSLGKNGQLGKVVSGQTVFTGSDDVISWQ